jgi:hypothetical protein
MTSLEFACWGIFAASMVKLYTERFVHMSNYKRYEKLILSLETKVNEYESVMKTVVGQGKRGEK